jgi:hypothetical protein
MVEVLLAFIAAKVGVDVVSLLALVGALVALANVIGKMIPDDATGPLGIVRKVCKVIGLYVPNKTVAKG